MGAEPADVTPGALDAGNTLDSHLDGSTLQELNLPFEIRESAQVSANFLPQLPPDAFPYVAGVLAEVMTSGRTEDFTFGLDLVLDGLERTLPPEPGRASPRN